ncbi:MAG: carbohydrate-binding protein [Fibrobacteria bacterium]
MRKGFPVLLLLVLLTAILWGCFGGATETETGTAQLTGEVKQPDGRPAVGARVRLRPSDFEAGELPEPLADGISQGDTVTDATGRFGFKEVKAGEYEVETVYSQIYGSAVKCIVSAGAKRTKLEPLTVERILTVTGRVRFSDGSTGPAKVHVLGTEHWAVADSVTGDFTLIDMPRGIFDVSVSTPLPFFAAKNFPGKVVQGTATVAIGDLVLDKGAKQEFTRVDGKLALVGIDGSNPVLYDNDYCTNTWDNEIIWAMASRGSMNLRGNLITVIPREAQPLPSEDISSWIGEARRCRLAGMRNIPEPMLGATRKLALPPSGRWQDIVPESNPGIALLVAEARKATAAKPLIVLSGSSLTTVAQAVLLDPYIADKMVVFGVYNQSPNARDSLASYLVAKHCRFVEWGRDYYWSGPAPSAAPLPGNWLGQELAMNRDTSSGPVQFFADYSALAFLTDQRVWKSARGAKVSAPPLNTSFDTSGASDFIDIPKEANDWALMDKVFFATLADSGAYHPWPVPGTIAGVSFRSMSGIKLDSIAAEGEIVAGISPSDWMEFAVEVAAEGDYDLIVRYQCDAQAQVRIGGQDSASQANLQLPSGSVWTTAQERIHLKQGTQTIRISTSKGAWKLSQIRLNPRA